MDAPQAFPPITTPSRHFIDNRWVPAATGATLPMVDPSDGSVFAAIAFGTAEDVARAVAAARRAFDGAWGRLAPAEKGRLLARLARTIGDHAEELALIEATRLRQADCEQARSRCGLALRPLLRILRRRRATRSTGPTFPFCPGYTALTLREPHGVVAGIIPWNYPLQILARVLGGSTCDGQHAGRQAGRGRLALRYPNRRTGTRSRHSGRGRQRRHRLRPRGGRGAVAHTRRRPRHLYRLARLPAPRSRRPPHQQPRSPWSWAGNHPRSCSPMPISTQRCRYW